MRQTHKRHIGHLMNTQILCLRLMSRSRSTELWPFCSFFKIPPPSYSPLKLERKKMERKRWKMQRCSTGTPITKTWNRSTIQTWKHTVDRSRCYWSIAKGLLSTEYLQQESGDQKGVLKQSSWRFDVVHCYWFERCPLFWSPIEIMPYFESNLVFLRHISFQVRSDSVI